MGGEFLKNSSPSPESHTDVFYEYFPFYLSIGMTYDQYWNDDCTLTNYYSKAHKLRNEYKNQELWLQGMYIYDALCCVSPVLHAFAKPRTKPLPYPKKPYDLTGDTVKEEKEKQEKANRDKAKALFEAWSAGLKLPNTERQTSAD